MTKLLNLVAVLGLIYGFAPTDSWVRSARLPGFQTTGAPGLEGSRAWVDLTGLQQPFLNLAMRAPREGTFAADLKALAIHLCGDPCAPSAETPADPI